MLPNTLTCYKTSFVGHSYLNNIHNFEGENKNLSPFFSPQKKNTEIGDRKKKTLFILMQIIDFGSSIESQGGSLNDSERAEIITIDESLLKSFVT